MAANATERAMRRAILTSPLRDFEAWLLEVDCESGACRRGRMYAVSALGGAHGRDLR